MNIYVPLATHTRKMLNSMDQNPWRRLEYSIDDAQQHDSNADLSLEVRVVTEKATFAFYGKACKKLQRFDVPQVAIDKVSDVPCGSNESCKEVPLHNRKPSGIALLWTAERFAGSNQVFSSEDVVIYVSGFMFGFDRDRSIVLSASQFEPDIFVVTEAHAVKSHIAGLRHIEFL